MGQATARGGHGKALVLTGFGALRGGMPLADPLTLTLEPGTVLGIVGPNGVGKSSLIGALARTGVDSFGSATLGSDELTKTRAARRAELVALMAQDHSAPGELTVRELVGVGAWASAPARRRRDAPAISSRIDHALARAGAMMLADRAYGSLSGGQRQLVQLARVLAQDTQVVLLDEPTSALDLGHQRSVERTMRGLGEDGRIVIAAIHDLSIALNVCTSVLMLQPGGSAHAASPTEALESDRVFDAYGVRTSIHTTSAGRLILAPDE